jgi:4-carboxymuconolactone decarboxylase
VASSHQPRPAPYHAPAPVNLPIPVHDMAIVLANVRWVPQPSVIARSKALDHLGITDVITVMGHYSSVATTLAFCDMPVGVTRMTR